MDDLWLMHGGAWMMYDCYMDDVWLMHGGAWMMYG